MVSICEKKKDNLSSKSPEFVFCFFLGFLLSFTDIIFNDTVFTPVWNLFPDTCYVLTATD